MTQNTIYAFLSRSSDATNGAIRIAERGPTSGLNRVYVVSLGRGKTV